MEDRHKLGTPGDLVVREYEFWRRLWGFWHGGDFYLYETREEAEKGRKIRMRLVAMEGAGVQKG